MTGDEIFLLKWLGQEDFSQYGECHGKTLDALIAQGLAQVHSASDHQGSFIAKGDGRMYRAVSLTEAGRIAIASMKTADGQP